MASILEQERAKLEALIKSVPDAYVSTVLEIVKPIVRLANDHDEMHKEWSAMERGKCLEQK